MYIQYNFDTNAQKIKKKITLKINNNINKIIMSLIILGYKIRVVTQTYGNKLGVILKL